MNKRETYSKSRPSTDIITLLFGLHHFEGSEPLTVIRRQCLFIIVLWSLLQPDDLGGIVIRDQSNNVGAHFGKISKLIHGQDKLIRFWNEVTS